MKDRLVARNLYKVFSSQPGRAMELAKAGVSKTDIFAQTGQVVGVNDASFSVHEGEMFVVMGLSGSGKSTLVRLLNRLIDPTAGQVLFDGTDISGISEKDLLELRRKHISMVFQSFALMPHLTVLQNAGFGLELAGEPKALRNEKAGAALEQVGLSARADSYPHELSGGMQQRVGLARALANNPSVLLMDEAFSALDPLTRAEMQDELIKLQRHDKRTIVFITHDIAEAFRIGDRVAMMEGGIVTQIGTPREIVRHPANDYVQSFFKNVDVAQIFFASDVSDPSSDNVISLDETNVRQAIEQLASRGGEYGFVVGADRRFHGVVSRATLSTALQKGRDPHMSAAYLLNTPVVTCDTPVSRLFSLLAGCLHDLPVVDAQGHYCGAVSKDRVLKLIGRESSASDCADSHGTTDSLYKMGEG